jgi:hypothetical protein
MREKWADRVYARVSDRELVELSKSFLGPVPDHHRTRDLEKNAFERQAIEECLLALGDLFAWVGVEPISISPERIHVLTDEEFETKVDAKAIAKTEFGHVYLRRTSDDERFVHDLTHELGHLASFWALQLRREGPDSRTYRISLRRLGLLSNAGRPGGHGMRFHGLDEGVTETFAHDLRRRLVSRAGCLVERLRKRLLSHWSYWPHVRLVEKLIEVVAPAPEERGDARRRLFVDHLKGSYGFLKELQRKRPGSIRIVSRMGRYPVDAYAAARQLGFDDLADDLGEKFPDVRATP